MRLAIAAVLACAACAFDAPLAQVSFGVRAGGVLRDASMPLVVTTAQGWRVTLSAAEVSVGPMYFRNGASGVGTDQDDGRVVAEVLPAFTVDALAPSLVDVPGGGRGSTEAARNADVRLVEAEDGAVANAAGADVAVAHVAGTAERGTVRVAFDASLTLPAGGAGSDYAAALSRRVLHIPVAFTPASGGALTLRVDPTHWLDAVAFDDTGEAPDFSARAPATQLLAGVASGASYVFTWEAR